jgi:hypothetical protein
VPQSSRDGETAAAFSLDYRRTELLSRNSSANVRTRLARLAAVIRHHVSLLVVIDKAPFPVLANNFVATAPKIVDVLMQHASPIIAKVYRPSPAELAQDPDSRIGGSVVPTTGHSTFRDVVCCAQKNRPAVDGLRSASSCGCPRIISNPTSSSCALPHPRVAGRGDTAQQPPAAGAGSPAWSRPPAGRLRPPRKSHRPAHRHESVSPRYVHATHLSQYARSAGMTLDLAA